MKARKGRLREYSGVVLNDLLEKESDEILKFLTDSQLIFFQFLNNLKDLDDQKDRELTALVFSVIRKALQSSDHESVTTFVGNLFQVGRFVFYLLTLYLNVLTEGDKLGYSLDDIADIFLSYQHSHPASSAQYFFRSLEQLREVAEKVFENDRKNLEKLLNKIRKLEAERSEFLKSYSRYDIPRLVKSEKLSKMNPPNDFRTIDLFPTAQEMKDSTPFLRSNVIIGPYKDVEHYLDVHFRLLREDYIRPLREGISTYKKSQRYKSNSYQGDKDVRVHENVEIWNPHFDDNGEEIYFATFDSQKFAVTNWKQNRRFLIGSILCMSHDNFQSIILASVDNTREIETGSISLKIEYVPPNFQHSLLNVSFVVIETDAYFVAYQFTLQALQKLNGSNFPMEKYIIRVQTTVDQPSYLKNSTKYDFEPLLQSNRFGNPTNVNVLDFNTWPTAEELHMDKSQYRALQSALTREFCIIQGPPGTGKTFIGLKIVQLLLHNSSEHLNLKPIIVISYTNHALDQFLEGLLDFTKNIIRIGGGITNSKLHEFKLERAVHRHDNFPVYLLERIKDLHRTISATRDGINTIHKNMKCRSESVLHYDVLSQFMTQSQRYGLRKLAKVKDGIWIWLTISAGLSEDLESWNENGEWYEARKIDGKLIIRNLKEGGMSSIEANTVENVWAIDLKDRWRLYKYWLSKYLPHGDKKLKEMQSSLRDKMHKLQVAIEDRNLYAMQQSHIIGMTTTGFTKRVDLMETLGPQVIIVEEAAEILETHIVTSLTSKAKHVILIGDHQQLRPKPNVYELTTSYNFDVSLFERMVTNNVEHDKLEVQHRMRPCIASLIVPQIYPFLENHASVRTYENILGIRKNVFFISHAEPERRQTDSESKLNDHEAEFIVNLCCYLMLQGYHAEKITILTTYVSQMYLIQNMMKERLCSEVKVSSIDNYQGEENDIVLISFVRSNGEGKMGFLSVSNRVCVALSRAKKGLYCIGNFTMYADNSKFWNDLIKTTKELKFFGSCLPLYCRNHPNSDTDITWPSNFKGVSDGGCSSNCEFRLPCGHMCPNKCHPWDPLHENFKCQNICRRILCDKGHECPKSCYEECGDCVIPLKKLFPNCGHVNDVPCCTFSHQMNCFKEISVELLCGHEKTQVKCCDSLGLEDFFFLCEKPCGAKLPCGHTCTGSCKECYQGRLHIACHRRCSRLLICGHMCRGFCSKPCPPCAEDICQRYHFNIFGTVSDFVTDNMKDCSGNEDLINRNIAQTLSDIETMNRLRQHFFTLLENIEFKISTPTKRSQVIPIYDCMRVGNKIIFFNRKNACISTDYGDILHELRKNRNLVKEARNYIISCYWYLSLSFDLTQLIPGSQQSMVGYFPALVYPIQMVLSKRNDLCLCTLIRFKNMIKVAMSYLEMREMYINIKKKFNNSVSESHVVIFKAEIFLDHLDCLILDFFREEYLTASEIQIRQVIQELKRCAILISLLFIMNDEDECRRYDIEHIGQIIFYLCQYLPFDKMTEAHFKTLDVVKKCTKFDMENIVLETLSFHSGNWLECAKGHVYPSWQQRCSCK